MRHPPSVPHADRSCVFASPRHPRGNGAKSVRVCRDAHPREGYVRPLRCRRQNVYELFLLRVDWTWEGGASAPKAFTSTDERALELVARLASSSDGDDLLEAAATVEFRRNVELAPREAFPVLCGSGVSASFAARHGRGPLKFASEASIDVDEQERIVVVGAASSTDAGVCGRATVAVDDAGLLGSTTATAVAIFAAVESTRVFQEKTPPERHELELGRNPLLIAEGETRTIYVDAFDGAVRRFSAASYEKMSIDVVARGAAVAFVGEGSAVCAQGSGSAADVGGCAGRWAFNVSGVRVGESTLVIKVRETGGRGACRCRVSRWCLYAYGCDAAQRPVVCRQPRQACCSRRAARRCIPIRVRRC